MTKPWLKDMTPAAMRAAMDAIGEKPFRAGQIFRWLYKEDEPDFARMTDLSKDLRARLAEDFSAHQLPIVDQLTAADGTEKFVLELHDGARIESVLIPEPRRLTVCVSTQVGCRFGCQFCSTGTMGLLRDLTPGEIVEQYLAAVRVAGGKRVTNLVMMGMGEPLDNLDNVTAAVEIMYSDHGLNMSPRKVTVSTVGLIPELAELPRRVDVSLAVSLHAADDETRNRLVPINKKYPIKELIDACRSYPMTHRRRVTFEYAIIEGVNDSDEDARRLVRLVSDLRPKVNLIAVNPNEDPTCQAPSDERVLAFQKILRDHNVTCMIRKSRGREIMAACGQLVAPPATKS
jgi:23S rRNA (adenine2503-C2)-methyltransferase